MIKEYIKLVHKLIEMPRNELRVKFMKTKDKELEKILNKYEEEYYRKCLKIEEYINLELENMDLNHKD